jgi:hypothetical protein
MRNASDKSSRRNQNTRFCIQYFFSENLAVYEIMCKNIVERGRPQMTIWLMRVACWIRNAAHTHTHTRPGCTTYCFSTATVVAVEKLIVIPYRSGHFAIIRLKGEKYYN